MKDNRSQVKEELSSQKTGRCHDLQNDFRKSEFYIYICFLARILGFSICRKEK